MIYRVYVSGGGPLWLQFETESKREANGEAQRWRKHGYYAEVVFTKEVIA